MKVVKPFIGHTSLTHYDLAFWVQLISSFRLPTPVETGVRIYARFHFVRGNTLATKIEKSKNILCEVAVFMLVFEGLRRAKNA